MNNKIKRKTKIKKYYIGCLLFNKKLKKNFI